MIVSLVAFYIVVAVITVDDVEATAAEEIITLAAAIELACAFSGIGAEFDLLVCTPAGCVSGQFQTRAKILIVSGF